jgi:hypothetical protein
MTPLDAVSEPRPAETTTIFAVAHAGERNSRCNRPKAPPEHGDTVTCCKALGVTSSRYTVTRSDAVTVTPQQKFTRSDLQKSVGEKQADRLRLLIVAGGHGAFVAAFRNRAEIVLAHVNRQSPKSAAQPVPGGLSFDQPTSPWRSLPPSRG